MSKARKTWTVIGAVIAGGVTIAIASFAAPIAEAGRAFN
jgi:hypothetical protein